MFELLQNHMEMAPDLIAGYELSHLTDALQKRMIKIGFALNLKVV